MSFDFFYFNIKINDESPNVQLQTIKEVNEKLSQSFSDLTGKKYDTRKLSKIIYHVNIVVQNINENAVI